MMYGFGDVPNPRDDTAELLEELVLEFLQDLVGDAAGPTSGAFIC